jgi:DnaJ like chaperone protein
MSSFFFRNIYFKIAKALIILSAKLSRADGQVTKVELIAIKDILKIPDNEIDQVAKIFNEAKKESADFKIHAEHIAKIYKNNQKVLEEILDNFFYIAEADGVVSKSELEMIESIAKIFGLNQTQFESVKNSRKNSDKLNPYVVLDVQPEDDLLLIRNKYIQLSKEHHPDLLRSKGVSVESIEESKQKMNSIISAWRRIQKLKS